MSGAELVRVPAALSVQSADAFLGSLTRAFSNDSRVVVLRGSEGTFCRGLDLEALATGDPGAGVTSFWKALRMIRDSSKPVIAAVDGKAIGGGVGIAAACDLVIVTEQASFGMPELLFGFVPAVVLPILRERLSPQKLRLAALLARTFTAAEAVACGLADMLAPDLDKALRVSVRQLSRAQSEAVQTLKSFTAAGVFSDESGLRITTETLARPAVAPMARAFMAGEALPWLKHD
jgi:enoyl-CoA hydratase/carnithine racemase